MSREDYFVYILECADHSYYTGYTKSLEERLRKHQIGKAAKYTRGRLPVQLIYYEKVETKSEGLKREYEIKQLSRKQKERLIKEGANNGYSTQL